MKKLIITLCAVTVVALLAGAALFGYTVFRAGHPLHDAGIVAPYLTGFGTGMLVFDAGPYKEGTAIVGSGGRAFWVKDGIGYVVNEAARKAAPDLAETPPDIQFDAEFIAAAEAGS